jgi:hypothetical protein
MKITTGFAAAAVLVGAAVGLASPAWADDFNGTYTYSTSGGATSTWTVTSCGPGCAHVVTKITNADAHLTNGQWVLVSHYDAPNGIRCNDGTQVASTRTFTWDATTLQGQVSDVSDGPACGVAGSYTPAPVPFSLTKVS